jgi:GTP-binding protein Era
MTDGPQPRTGYVAIVGRPNVGKSTLLNALVGEKVSITSRKPQTTRERVLGVMTRGEAPQQSQFIFVDTPGLQRRHGSLLNRRMNEAVRQALASVDAAVLVIEARGWTAEDDAVLALVPRPESAESSRVILAINKCDLLAERKRLLPLMAASSAKFPFAALVPVSAERKQTAALLDEIGKLLPAGELLFEPDAYTDRSERFLAAELVREKAFRLLGDELPYGIAVTIDRWVDEEGGGTSIIATLVVERDSHKGIVIGKGGSKLKEIGTQARRDIAALLGRPVHLETHVRVRQGWHDDAAALRSFGYE